MPHPAARKFSGGKKGPRQVTGKRQVKATLRPRPVAGPSRPRDGDADGLTEDEAEDDDEAVHPADEQSRSTVYGYREALTREGKPLAGFKVSISGCTAIKEDLWALAVEYGAERHPGLLADTTHLVTETHESEKYRVALQHGILVMKPSWLWAVRDAWVGGESIDYRKLEDEHRFRPLTGVVACLTQFARGVYKDNLKAKLVQHGATVQAQLTPEVTHLVVASPSAPHSQTPSSDKLLQARRNAHRLHPELAIVWENWVAATISRGGPRSDDAVAYQWREGASESESVHGSPKDDDTTSMKGARPRRSPAGDDALSELHSNLMEGKPFDLAEPGIFGEAPPNAEHAASNQKRTQAKPTVAAEVSAPLSSKQDDLRILKKRRIGERDKSRADHDPHMAWILQSTTTGEPRALPCDDEPTATGRSTAASTSARLSPGAARHDLGQTTAGTGTVIRALGARRNGVWTGGDSSHPVDLDGGPPRNRTSESTEWPAGRREGSIQNGAQPSVSTHTQHDPIFDGRSFALVNLKGPDPAKLADVIASYGGKAVIDPADTDTGLSAVDWIVVDYAEPDEAFFRSTDRRVVSICWLELCIHNNALLTPAERLLERPLGFLCPVPGADAICAHFSGYSEASPILHHIRRFLSAVGATFSPKLTRKVTHLVFDGLDDLGGCAAKEVATRTNPAKVAKAREWQIPIISLQALRSEIDRMALPPHDVAAGRHAKEARDAAAAANNASHARYRTMLPNF
ncbi:hypothetical protein JCM10908_007009 [Rhodotorula pacifica]|uniref:uncharacterized protein n=1 Tax=Rhodotorula pacifica TaxID=1495444 RepID=UPI00317661F8